MWIQERSTDESLVVLRDVARVCASSGGEISSYLYSLVRSEKYSDLLEYNFDYLTISDLNDLVYARQIQALFSKLEPLELPGVDRRYAAALKFAQSEVKCASTNRFLRRIRNVPCEGAAVHDKFLIAQRLIADVLGEVPDVETLKPSFGPGANTSVKGSLACPRVKLSAQLQCSNDISPYLSQYLETVPEWIKLHAHIETSESFVVDVDVVPGRLMFVPKNAKTNRCIIVEPLLNSFFQKGVGSYIRGRLKTRSRVDLRDQSINQRLALKGSITGSLATVDLSSASDTISSELVWDLLPYDWACFLDSLRTSHVSVSRIDAPAFSEGGVDLPSDGVIKMEKFSSMGNGFTFELESLIFWALARAYCSSEGHDVSEISVYGDDIIIPTKAFTGFSSFLSLCGFDVNLSKSYGSGNFRESCGSDYYSGFDIRPYYQKTLVSDRTLYSMHNWFMRRGERELAAVCIRHIRDQDNLLYGPDGFGDGHLIGSHQLRRNRQLIRSGWGGGYFDTYTLRPRRFKKPLPGDAVLPVYSVYTRSGAESPTDPDVIRGSRGYAKISIYTLTEMIFGK